MSHSPSERATNYAGVDLTRHPALKESYRIACLIEACGASPELTTASCAAFDFIRTLDLALRAADEPDELPYAWMRQSGGYFDFSRDDARPSGEGWVPLYRRPEPPSELQR